MLHPVRPWDFRPVGDDGEIPALPPGASWPAVAVIVPARNEADALPRTLPALLQQDYPAPFRVFLVDDRSTDGTARTRHGQPNSRLPVARKRSSACLPTRTFFTRRVRCGGW